MFRDHNFPCVILRPSEIYGGKGGFFKELQLDGYINGKIPIIGKGNNNISFTYIEDLVQAIKKSIEKPNIEGQIFNINTPGVITLNDLIKLIKSQIRTKPIFRVPVFMGWMVAGIAVLLSRITSNAPFMDFDVVKVATMQSGERSIEKAKSVLGFEPRHQNIESGIINSYFANELK